MQEVFIWVLLGFIGLVVVVLCIYNPKVKLKDGSVVPAPEREYDLHKDYILPFTDLYKDDR